MDEEHFWSIIEASKGDAEKVANKLKELTAEEIAAFQKTYYEHHNRLHHWNIWGAAYVINDGCGDDSFHYFKAWLIGKGKKVYETALQDPDSLGPFVTEADLDDGCDNELLNYAAEEAYEAATGRSSEEMERDSNESEEPAGTAWDEDNVHRLFPKLAAKFG